VNVSQEKILISILNWNSFVNTSKCIESILGQNYLNYEILVLDNFSLDGSLEQLKQKFPQLIYHQFNTNIGYAGGHHFAATYANEHDFNALWVINNDLEVSPDALDALMDAFHRNGLGLFGSLVLESDNEDQINFAGGWELSKNGGLDYATPYNQFIGKSWNLYCADITERKVSDVNGCSIFIPVDLIQKFGFMEDIFFLYKEETDFCFSLMEKGVPSYIVPTSIVIHQSGGSFVNEKLRLLKTYYSERNLILFMKRHPKYFVPYRNPLKKYRPLWDSLISLLMLILKAKTQSHEFYKNLGILHAMIGIKGKYFSPERHL